MNREEIAELLEQVAIDMGNALMPKANDPDRGRKAYVLGIASAAVLATAGSFRRPAVADFGASAGELRLHLAKPLGESDG